MQKSMGKLLFVQLVSTLLQEIRSAFRVSVAIDATLFQKLDVDSSSIPGGYCLTQSHSF